MLSCAFINSVKCGSLTLPLKLTGEKFVLRKRSNNYHFWNSFTYAFLNDDANKHV